MVWKIVSDTAIPGKGRLHVQRLCQTVANVANATPMCPMSCLGIVEVQEDHQVEESDFAVTDIYSNINMSVCNDIVVLQFTEG